MLVNVLSFSNSARMVFTLGSIPFSGWTDVNVVDDPRIDTQPYGVKTLRTSGIPDKFCAVRMDSSSVKNSINVSSSGKAKGHRPSSIRWYRVSQLSPSTSYDALESRVGVGVPWPIRPLSRSLGILCWLSIAS